MSEFPPSDQWSLEECLTFALNGIDNSTRMQILSLDETGASASLHHDLGRWIRNNCKLWEHGTDRLAADIVDTYRNGTYSPPSMSKGRFRPPDGFLSASFIVSLLESGMQIDDRLTHPDNCSWVVIEILLDKLKQNGHDS